MDDLQDPQLAPAAALALQTQGSRAVPALIDALEHEEHAVFTLASEVIASIGVDALPALAVELRKTSAKGGETLLGRVVDTLERMGPTASPLAPDLLDLIRRTHSEFVARRVANAWSAMGAAALPEIREALRSETDAVASVGEAAAWRLGPPAVEPLLHDITEDSAAAVRLRSAHALLTMLRNSSRTAEGLPLSDHNGHYKEYVSIDGQAVGERVLRTLCGPPSSACVLSAASRAVVAFYGAPELVCAAPAERVALTLALRNNEFSTAALLGVLKADRDPRSRARALRSLVAWAANAPEDVDTTPLLAALLRAVAVDKHLAQDAAGSVVALYADLPRGDLELVVDFYIGRSAPGHFPTVPTAVLGQYGARAFEVLLAVAGDTTRAGHERIVAIRAVADADLHKLAAESGLGAEERLANRRKEVLAQVETTSAGELRTEAVSALISSHHRHGTLQGFAGRLSEYSKHDAPGVRLAATNGLRFFLPPRGSTVQRGSTRETDTRAPDPPRPFSRGVCSRARRAPSATESAERFATWATCRLHEMRSDSDAHVAKAASDTLVRAGLDITP